MRYLTGLGSLCLLLINGLVSSGQSPLLPRDPAVKGPQTFAIILGVSKYKHVKPLAYADKDALLFRDYLKSPGGGTVKDENIFLLLNDKASNSNFWGKGFQWLKAKKLQRGDRLFIYLAGHGDAIDEDQFFFLGYDCNPAGDKNNYLVAGAIQLFNLKKKIADETAKGVDVFFIMDACRSNELPGGARGQNFLNTAISEKQAGEIIMLATGAGQESLEDASIGTGQGLFTYYLVDGLNGVADAAGTADNRVTFREIQNHVNRNVPSVAQQRFKRKQDPYFCCTENSDKIISNVDSGYLQKWLKTKKKQRGPGNSFSGTGGSSFRMAAADTLLTETYNRFYRAINNRNITGSSSAEEYFRQLDKKFPGNPYTLDARSTLAVEYINEAQAKVDRYLSCGEDASPKQKQDNTEAANRLEQAIAYVREDDEDFARSLLGRMYLLRASGTNPSATTALQYAYGALAIDPEGAYILNKLALLHLENNHPDSALFYAGKASKIAPGWLCALSTLALVKKTLAQNKTGNSPDTIKRKENKGRKYKSFGLSVGFGIAGLDPTFAERPNSEVLSVSNSKGTTLQLGFSYYKNIGKNIAVNPLFLLIFEDGTLVFERRNPAGGTPFKEDIKIETMLLNISAPFVFRLTSKKVAPFVSVGPSFRYILSRDSTLERILPVKNSMIMGDGALGLDIGLKKAKIIISPEIKYSHGFTDIRKDANTIYTNAISSLRKRSYTFTIYLRNY